MVYHTMMLKLTASEKENYMSDHKKRLKLLRPCDVAYKLGIGLSTFWRWKNDNALDFPKGVKMKRGTCWIEQEVDEWILRRERVS